MKLQSNKRWLSMAWSSDLQGGGREWGLGNGRLRPCSRSLHPRRDASYCFHHYQLLPYQGVCGNSCYVGSTNHKGARNSLLITFWGLLAADNWSTTDRRKVSIGTRCDLNALSNRLLATSTKQKCSMALSTRQMQYFSICN
jgi:hypothetical protein